MDAAVEDASYLSVAKLVLSRVFPIKLDVLYREKGLLELRLVRHKIHLLFIDRNHSVSLERMGYVIV